jgi:hypothetical protein
VSTGKGTGSVSISVEIQVKQQHADGAGLLVRVRQGFKTPGYTGENALKAFREPL